MDKFRALALIPARSGSKRIRNKNIKLLNGQPLIAYSISSAIQSKIFDDIIVSTDSKEYKKIAEYYGANVYLRPKQISADNSPDIEWVEHVLNNNEIKEKKYDYFSILRPSSPFRMPATIKRAIKRFLKSTNVDSLRAVEVCSQHPAKMWVAKNNIIEPVMVGKNNNVPWHSCQFSSLPKIFVQNASLEISKTSNVIDKHSISGDKIMPFFTEGLEGFDINQPYDWEYANYLIENNLVNLPKINTANAKP